MNSVWNKADWANDHKHSDPCEIPPSIGAFSRHGAPQPSGDPVLTVFAEEKKTELCVLLEKKRKRKKKFKMLLRESEDVAAAKNNEA